MGSRVLQHGLRKAASGADAVPEWRVSTTWGERSPLPARGRHGGALFLCALLAAVACAGGEGPAQVEIVEPADGAVVNSRDVRVVLAAAGVEIAPASEERPGTAHHHLFIDRALTSPHDTIPSGVTGIVHLGRGQTEFVVEELTPGTHRVIAVLADWAHLPLGPLATDTVRFAVRP